MVGNRPVLDLGAGLLHYQADSVSHQPGPRKHQAVEDAQATPALEQKECL